MVRSSADPAGSFQSRLASRRTFLQVGTAALGGIAAAAISPQVAVGSPSMTRGKAVIFVYLAGGPSHLDMYDLKPEAAAEIRGEFRPIATRIPGMKVCEYLPLHAKIADKLTIVNGIETIDTQNESVVTTGYLFEEQRPSLFEVVAALSSQRAAIRGWESGAGDPHLPLSSVNTASVHNVAAALAKVEAGIPAVMLRLAENALPHGDWDTHGNVEVSSANGSVRKSRLNIFEELREKLPAYDRAIYELVTKLHRRGLDQNVLVVACGEFGRTPWINRYGGRNHWASCGSVLFAGGGLRMGQVVGDTGPIGERSRTRAYTAQNVLATIYHHLGINPAMRIENAAGQAVPLLDQRQVIDELV